VPKSVTALDLTNHYSFIEISELSLVPKHITSLSVCIAGIKGAEPLTLLPTTNLTSLSIYNATHFTDSDIAQLPANLNLFWVPTISLYGGGFLPGTKSVDSSNLARSFQRALSVPLCHHLRLADGMNDPYHDHMLPRIKVDPGNPNYWPASITTLKWTASKPPIHQIFWKLPNLTDINCPGPLEKGQDIPLSVTRLSWGSPLERSLTQYQHLTDLSLPKAKFHKEFGVIFPPSLLTLKVGSVHPKCITNLKKLTVLLFYEPDLTADMIKQYPESLTNFQVGVYPRQGSPTEFWYPVYQQPASIKIRCSELPRNLRTFAHYKWHLSLEELSDLPPSITLISCAQILISDVFSVLDQLNSRGKTSSGSRKSAKESRKVAQATVSKATPGSEKHAHDISSNKPSQTQYPGLAKALVEEFLASQYPNLRVVGPFFDERSGSRGCAELVWSFSSLGSSGKPKTSSFNQAIAGAKLTPSSSKTIASAADSKGTTPGKESTGSKTSIWALLPRHWTELVLDEKPAYIFPKLTARDFTVFPPKLVHLDLGSAAIPHNAPKYLPSSITTLIINGSLFNQESIGNIPRKVRSLRLETKKWLPKYSRSLPSSLTRLTLSCPTASNMSVRELPTSLTWLVIRSAGLDDKSLSVLPPNLTFFRSNSAYITKEGLKSFPLKQLRTLKLPCANATEQFWLTDLAPDFSEPAL
jgi:hypothetical protein